MSLALIPYEDLEAIALGSVSEDAEASGPRFDFNDFQRQFSTHQRLTGGNRRKPNYKAWLKQYMASVSGVKYAGAGSSRIAFILDRKAQGIPGNPPGCCLKVAWNEKGVAQNLAEDKVFGKYGDLECFPKVFDSDPDGMWTITEIGSRLTAKSFDMVQLKRSWNTLANRLEAPEWLFMGTMAERNDITNQIAMVLTSLDAYKDRPRNADLVKRLSEDREKTLQLFPELQTMMSLVDFTLKNGWNEVGIGDLRNKANWAVVFRFSTETSKMVKMPIPIDWGFTFDVMMEFYH